MNRAYSILTVKSVDEEHRIIKGIASTPTMDRQLDIVDPKGAMFKLPLPLKWEHKHVVGTIHEASVSDVGIEITATIPKIAEPGRLKDEVDYAWQSIKAGLVRGLSVGIMADIREQKKTAKGGVHWLKWFLTEVSAVAIPANAEASISLVKSIDTDQRAASGKAHRIVRLDPPAGASAIQLKARRPLI